MLCYVRITAEVSQILVLCETPIQWEQFCLVFIANTCNIWYFIQFVHNAIFMSLHGPAGACDPKQVIHVPQKFLPIQCYNIIIINNNIIINNIIIIDLFLGQYWRFTFHFVKSESSGY